MQRLLVSRYLTHDWVFINNSLLSGGAFDFSTAQLNRGKTPSATRNLFLASATRNLSGLLADCTVGVDDLFDTLGAVFSLEALFVGKRVL